MFQTLFYHDEWNLFIFKFDLSDLCLYIVCVNDLLLLSILYVLLQIFIDFEILCVVNVMLHFCTVDIACYLNVILLLIILKLCMLMYAAYSKILFSTL